MRDLRGGLVRTTLGCVLAGTVLLTGCAEKQEASTSLPTAEPAPTTESLPPLGPADMPMPAEARTQDAAGAEAFVRYYFDLLNQSLETMDPQHLRSLADDGCDVCERIAKETESDAAQGYSYAGGELAIASDISVVVIAPDEAQSAFIADQAPMTVLDGSGVPVPDLTFDGERGLSSGAIAVWDSFKRTWLLSELTLG